jgi:protein arginine kinase activator
MICTSCKEAEALVFIKHIVDNQVSQAALCADCAAKAHVPLNPVNPAAALLQLLAKPGALRARVPAAPRCPGCAGTWADFRATGRLGCARCYDHFAALLRPLVPRIHAGAYVHRGKSPQTPPPAP